MYKEHPVFHSYKSTNKPIWRYMDFWKFLNLLATKSLYFSTSDNLGDNNEGRIPSFVLSKMVEQDKIRGNKRNEELNGFLESNLRKTTLISSWTYAERESFAMWKMYAKDKTGIAIETDFNSLKDSFIKTSRSIYIGEINYINEDNYFFTLENMFYPFLTKLDFYQFENELRCMSITKDDEIAESKLIEIDLRILIKKVHISPNSKPEFKTLIELLKKEYELGFEICYSKVNDSWL